MFRTNHTFSPHTPPPSRGAEGASTFWHQGNAAPFACQEKRRPELGRAFLLPMRSLVKCIPDRPMHAGVIVMASRGISEGWCQTLFLVLTCRLRNQKQCLTPRRFIVLGSYV